MTQGWYLYHHIPKCAGCSFIEVCGQWFPLRNEHWGSYPDRETVAACAKTRLDLATISPGTFLHGHYIYDGLRPHERYPEAIAARQVRLITVLRDPLERAISAYFYRAKKNKNSPEDTLESWIKKHRNRMARFLGVTPETWRAQLDAYFHVGTCEQLGLTLDLLAKKTGNPPIDAPLRNVTERSGPPLSEETIATFRERNTLDYAVFTYAADRLQREAQTLG